MALAQELHCDLTKPLSAQLFVLSLEQKLWSEAEHLFHLAKRPLMLMESGVDFVHESMEGFGLSSEIGDASRNRSPLTLYDSCGLV
jgi:hypothetical protein